MITSRSNPAVKAIRGLRDRRERTRTGLMLAEGTQLVAEAIQTGMDVVQLVGTPDRVRSPFAQELIAEAGARGVPFLEVSADVYDWLAESEGRQGLCAVVRQRWVPLGQVRPDEGRVWVALNAIQYPGNLGTIMRTLDSVGGAGVILLGSSTDTLVQIPMVGRRDSLNVAVAASVILYEIFYQTRSAATV